MTRISIVTTDNAIREEAIVLNMMESFIEEGVLERFGQLALEGDILG